MENVSDRSVGSGGSSDGSRGSALQTKRKRVVEKVKKEDDQNMKKMKQVAEDLPEDYDSEDLEVDVRNDLKLGEKIQGKVMLFPNQDNIVVKNIKSKWTKDQRISENEKEIWFKFGAENFRFSLAEFAIVFGLLCVGDFDLSKHTHRENTFVDRYFCDQSVTVSAIEHRSPNCDSNRRRSPLHLRKSLSSSASCKGLEQGCDFPLVLSSECLVHLLSYVLNPESRFVLCSEIMELPQKADLGDVKPNNVAEDTVKVVVETLRMSTFLKISEDGKKVGRTNELMEPEELIEQLDSRTVAISPFEHNTKQEGMEAFFGKFAKVLQCKPLCVCDRKKVNILLLMHVLPPLSTP
ncbi:hypothetical protein G4B88_002884 [Cannabis sativa]|uniref:DUF1985 domain-containing protein n=1 Tax=Cannabis sativa TaxID=3483 RepID=A0A7J6DMV4_CANSA|nr:hypothetical protein G4B88_002884 [Cannabis sativa]